MQKTLDDFVSVLKKYDFSFLQPLCGYNDDKFFIEH